ncbi:hypothetical protein ACIQU5_27910 [Streptomyces sp. NPDC090306]|uniref:hypothetical protein n=1 Tax=Streptomyces sp. NPDC090306 TaxID=3365961 RepID=UPI0038101325
MDPREALRCAELLFLAVERAEGLGWTSIRVGRLSRLARGDDTGLPPDPTTAPSSVFGPLPTPYHPDRRPSRRKRG